MKILKKILAVGMIGLIAFSAAACGGESQDQVVIYTNADQEAVEAMENALDNNGYEGRYILQTFGTSELGGRILAEGTNIEADLITMSSFYIESAQAENSMFLDLTFDANAMKEYPSYYTPITCQEGALIINTEALAAEGLEAPTSIKDLADPKYEGHDLDPGYRGFFHGLAFGSGCDQRIQRGRGENDHDRNTQKRGSSP